MMKIKVGMMPGKLVEVVVEEGTSAREIFRIADVELSNHEVRLDGEKVDLDTRVHNGNLLVAMKMIKGNMPTIKVGMMPGRLEVVEYTEGELAHNIFERANIELSNHEVRLDGEKITLDTRINNGSLLVAMKMIKGNSGGYYKTDCTESEIKMLLEVELPQLICASDVKDLNNNLLQINVYGEEIMVGKDMFESVYEIKEVKVAEITPTSMINTEFEEIVNKDNTGRWVGIEENECVDTKAINILELELEGLKIGCDFHIKQVKEINGKITLLEDLIRRIKA